MRAYRVPVAIVVLCLALVGMWFGIAGIVDGSVAFPSKRLRAHVLRAEAPVTFWACITMWIALGTVFLALAIANLRAALRRG
ncbi:MAG: hypothetical protein ACTHJP_11490 [Rhodanobacteraceae bacterium]